MDPLVTSALISAGSTVAGSLLGGGNKGPSSKDRKNMIHDTAMSNEAAISGKINAARKYGISPLYALGAPTVSSSWVPGSSEGPNLGGALAQMGQDVSRAVAAGQTTAERQLQDLTLQKAALENDLLRAQIGSLNATTNAQVAPPSIGLVPEKIQAPQRTTGANFAAVPVPFDPVTSDWGQIIEDRYGDDNPLTWPIGAAVMARDIDHHFSTMLPVGYRTPAEAGASVRKLIFGE